MKTYQNELFIPKPGLALDARRSPENNAGAGDPFVMRHNGRYYLYPSSPKNNEGIYAWVSKDMITWNTLDVVAVGEEIRNAYAPEVFYANGRFLMATSPRGEGHYLLASDNPAGPFCIIRDNFGHVIDGSFFMDDDAKLYFTHAEFPCIYGHEMQMDGSIGPGVRLDGTSMGHWTEGPMIFKRAGKYYITMTGNHLISRAYRIDYAVSDTGPLGPYRMPEDKTLLVDTRRARGSLGHSSTVIGPDLDSYWMYYHNYLIDEKGVHRRRHANLDRILFNGERMMVAGPTFFEAEAPKRPDFEGWADDPETADRFAFSADCVETLAQTPAGAYTAEVNLVPGERAELAFGAFSLRFSADSLEMTGEALVQPIRVKLFDGYRRDVLHAVRAELRLGMLSLLLDGMTLWEAVPVGGREGRIAVRGADRVSYVAFSRYAAQRSDFEHYGPVPGAIDAAMFLPVSYSHDAAQCGFRPEDGVRMLPYKDGGWQPVLREGETLSYRLNVENAGLYRVQLLAKGKTGSRITLDINGQRLTARLNGEALGRMDIGLADLRSGFMVMHAAVTSGEIAVGEWTLFPAVEHERLEYSGLALCHAVRQIEGGGLLHGEGGFIDRLEGLQMDRPIQALGILGDRYHTDSRVEADIIFRGDGDGEAAGLFIRLSQDSYYPDQVKVGHRGYFFGFNRRKARIARLNFRESVLAECDCPLDVETGYRLAASVIGGDLQLWLDGRLILSVHEDDPLPYGSMGVGSFGARVTFTRMAIDAR